MRGYLLAWLLLFLATTGARASILTLYMLDGYNDTSDSLYAPSPVAFWSGPYVGGHLSANWTGLSDSNVTLSNGGGSGSFGAGGTDTGGAAVGGGINIGYNVTSGGAVVGVEGDLSYSHFSRAGRDLVASDVVTGGDSLTGRFTAGQDFSLSLRGRVGLLLTPQTLLYATGGFVAARTKGSLQFTYTDGGPVAGSATDARLATGWVIGAGIEDNFLDNISARVEYLFTYYPATVFNFEDAGMTYRYSGAMNSHQLRFGLNFKF